MEEYNSSLKLLIEIEKQIGREQEKAEKDRYRLFEVRQRKRNKEFFRCIAEYRESLPYCPRDNQRTTKDGS